MGVSSISSIMRPGEPGLCCVVTSLCLVAGQYVTTSSHGSWALLLVVLWSCHNSGRGVPLLPGMEGTCEGGLQSRLLPWGWGWEGTSSLSGGGMGCCCRLEVQRRLGSPGLQGPASRFPWPSCQGCRFSQEDLRCHQVRPALVECSVSLRFSQSCRILG